MNKQIESLYHQAHSVRTYTDDDPMRGGNTPTVYWEGEKSAEKFANLIIKQCCARIALIGISNFENEDILWTVDYGITSICEHFGIQDE